MNDDIDLITAFDEGFDEGSLVSHLTPEREAALKAAARQMMNPPKKQISARLSERDLIKLKARAMEQGIPYQTLLSSLVHRYVEGRLVEKD